MNMRPSRVLRKLRAGEVVSCVKLNLGDAHVAEIAAMAGFDCIWTDLEHVPTSVSEIEHQVRAAKLHDVDTLVRVQRGSYSDLVRPLEIDAAGVMVPHVKTADEARQIAQQTRFMPLGRRPIDGGNADGAYCAIDTATYVQQANDQRFVIVQIEDPEAMDELEAIAATPGIDMLFFGRSDFAHGLGIAGKRDDPRIDEARQAVAEAAVRHDKFAATVGTADTLPQLVAMGYRFISMGADVVALSQRFGEIRAVFDAAKTHEATRS